MWIESHVWSVEAPHCVFYYVHKSESLELNSSNVAITYFDCPNGNANTTQFKELKLSNCCDCYEYVLIEIMEGPYTCSTSMCNHSSY